jgi:hypothetical protein
LQGNGNEELGMKNREMKKEMQNVEYPILNVEVEYR